MLREQLGYENLEKRRERLDGLRRIGRIDELSMRRAASLGDAAACLIFPNERHSSIAEIIIEEDCRFAMEAALYALDLLLPHYHHRLSFDGKPEKVLAASRDRLLGLPCCESIRKHCWEMRLQAWRYRDKAFDQTGFWRSLLPGSARKSSEFSKLKLLSDAYYHMYDTVSRSSKARAVVEIYRTAAMFMPVDAKGIFCEFLLRSPHEAF